jgi:2-isopropylmalate synthase
LGVELEQEKLDKTYEAFLRLADKKKELNDDDLLMLAGTEKAENNHVQLE